MREIYKSIFIVLILTLIIVYTYTDRPANANGLFIKEPLTSFKYEKVEISKLIKGRNFFIVKKYLKDMLAYHSHLFYANSLFALLYAMENKPNISSMFLKKARGCINSKRKHISFLFYRLKIYMILREDGYFKNSIEIIAKLKRYNASKPKVYYYEGILYFYHGNFLKALKYFRKVVNLNSVYKRRAENAINKI